MRPDNKTTFVEDFMSNKANHVLWRRWAAMWIDLAAMWLILMLCELILGSALYQSTVLIWVVLALSYYPISEGLTGFTLGKYFLCAKVIDKHGNNPGMRKALIRTLLRLVEANPIFIGGAPAGICVLMSSKGQRLGDKIAGTFVIDSNKYKQLMNDMRHQNPNNNVR